MSMITTLKRFQPNTLTLADTATLSIWTRKAKDRSRLLSSIVQVLGEVELLDIVD
jgi:hypothetical protein